MELWILEDDVERRIAMTDAAMKRGFQLRLFLRSSVFIDAIRSANTLPDVVSLDHDLHHGSGGTKETGREVSDFIASMPPFTDVIVHSTNEPESQRMVRTLQDAGYRVDKIVPFGDLAWVSHWASMLPQVEPPTLRPTGSSSALRLTVDARVYELLQRWDPTVVIGVVTKAGEVRLFESRQYASPERLIFPCHADLLASRVCQQDDCIGGFSILLQNNRIKAIMRLSKVNGKGQDFLLRPGLTDMIRQAVAMELDEKFKIVPAER